MNKYSIASLLLFFSFFPSCVEEEIPSEIATLTLVHHGLGVSTNNIVFGYNTSLTGTLTITAENTDWEIIGCPEWLTLSQTNGHGTTKVLLSAKENKSAEVSYASSLTVRSVSEGYPYIKTIAVYQQSANPFITPAKTSAAYSFAAQTDIISISSSVDWYVETYVPWLTATAVNNEKLSISMTENPGGEERKATISLRRKQNNQVYATISVTQGEGGVTGSLEAMSFDPDGGTLSRAINADVSWTAYTSDNSWFSVTPSSGQRGNNTLKVTVKANTSTNSKSGFVYVKIGDVTKFSIPVNQEGISLKVDPTSLDFESVKSGQSFTIEANTKWQVVSTPSWLTLSESSGGKGSTTITASVEDNPNASPYYGEIIIGKDGFYGNRYIPVSQKGKTFEEFGSNKMEFLNEASSSSVEIKTNGHWEASADKQWIHLSPTSGDGNGNLNVSVDKNNNKDARSGIITVKVGTTVQQITVNQEGQYVNLTYSGLLKDSKPATIEVTLTSNAEWTASSSSDWLTVSPSNGSGNSKIEVFVADNPSVNSRTGNILVSTLYDTKMLTFTQPGRTLSVSTDAVEFTAAGGTSASITITTDGQYKITTSDSWLQIEDKGSSFTIKTSVNTGDYSRTGVIIVSLTDMKDGEELKRKVSVSQGSIIACSDDNHPHAIGLGLPSGTKWACCNVGASKPEGYGGYYAWGEVNTKTYYGPSTSQFAVVDMDMKYGNRWFGDDSSDKIYRFVAPESDITGTSMDAATANWGTPWQLPSQTQIEELLNNTVSIWTTENRVYGRKFTGPNGGSIFLPAAGCRWDSHRDDVGKIGHYLSSTLYESVSDNFKFIVHPDGAYSYSPTSIFAGQSVRPVQLNSPKITSF